MQKAWHGGMLGFRFDTFSCRFLKRLFTFSHVHTGEAHPFSYYYGQYFSFCCSYISPPSCTKDEQFHDYPNGIHPILFHSMKAMKSIRLTISLCLNFEDYHFVVSEARILKDSMYMLLGRKLQWRLASDVTWVEHVEVDERAVHRIYDKLVSSGIAFGSKRWLSTLERQCERLASRLACNIPARDLGVISNPEGRRSMLKLAERMTNSFCAGVSASNAHTWTTLSGSGAEDVRVMTRKSIDDPGRPPGIVLSAATSFWLPATPMRVFQFLRDENLRNEWDILSNGGLVQEMAHIANGQDPGNCVSLLRVNNLNSNQGNMLILQESCTDACGSYVIYAPVDIVAMNVVLNGGDPDYVALLPSGFAILPDGTQSLLGNNLINDKISSGSLLTVAFQILVDSVPTAKLSLGSVATVNSLISCTVDRIKTALNCENA